MTRAAASGAPFQPVLKNLQSPFTRPATRSPGSRFRPKIEFQLRCDTVRRTDEDLDIGTQPPGLGGQSLDLLARAGGRREQHNTLADDRKVPTHSGVPVITEERDAWPAHNTLT